MCEDLQCNEAELEKKRWQYLDEYEEHLCENNLQQTVEESKKFRETIKKRDQEINDLKTRLENLHNRCSETINNTKNNLDNCLNKNQFSLNENTNNPEVFSKNSQGLEGKSNPQYYNRQNSYEQNNPDNLFANLNIMQLLTYPIAIISRNADIWQNDPPNLFIRYKEYCLKGAGSSEGIKFLNDNDK